VQTKPDYYEKIIRSVISLKAETHNFQLTVEPLMGGYRRLVVKFQDRFWAGEKVHCPGAGNCRLYDRLFLDWKRTDLGEKGMKEKELVCTNFQWILIKASNVLLTGKQIWPKP